MLTPLLGKSIGEIETAVLELGGTTNHAQKLIKWLYKHTISSFEEINTIPLTLRKAIDSKYSIGQYPPIAVNESSDSTRKFLFENKQDQRFEAVYMPDDKRNTLCISTQSGCRMGCKFCLTGKIGFNGNLTSLDIVNQLYSIREKEEVNRLVIMGMGEPFDNYPKVEKAIKIFTAQWGFAFGASNITLSSVGIKSQLEKFLQKPFCNLAISLHSPFPDERKELMPIENSNPISEVINILKENPIKKPLRLSFEYVALGGINTSERHANAIAELLHGLKYHLNIICWNSHDGSIYNSPTNIELNTFISCLNSNGVLTAVRKSRGKDIGAACGQMAGR